MGKMIGANYQMRDARERVVGNVQFTLNHEVPGMVHAQVVRSAVPHGHIINIDTAFAEEQPGVLAVITGADLLEQSISPYYGSVIIDQPALAIDKVRYAGEPVALVVAETEHQAREALVYVDVEYEELPFYTDTLEAIQEGATLLHDDFARNICARRTLRHGNLEEGWATSDRIYEDVFTSPPANHVPMEPHTAVAEWTENGVEVWTSTQAPYSPKKALARMFSLAEDQVRIRTFNLGGAYGAKTTTKIEPMVACAARIVGRPVRLELDREGVFFTLGKHATWVRIRTGVKEDGTLVAREMEVVWDGGAYADTSPGGVAAGLVRAPGPYRIPNVAIDSTAVYTNTVPTGPFRGAYTSQVAWAYESQLDDIAADLGIDPLALRRKNLLQPDDVYATGETISSAHFLELVDDVAAGVRWEQPVEPSQARRARGKGLAVILKSATTPSRSEIRLRLQDNGLLSIYTSSVEMGQGASATLIQLLADALDVSPDLIQMPFPDTEMSPYDLKTAGSRTTFTMGTALLQAASRLQEALVALASEQLDVPPSTLVHAGGSVGISGNTESFKSYGAILREARRTDLLVEGVYQSEKGLSSLDPETGQGIAADHWHQGAAAAEVEVDLETGKVEVLACHGAAFAGCVVNPHRVRQQNQGGMIFALGQVFFEEIRYDSGSLVNPNLSDYMIPSILDIPRRLTSSAIETEEQDMQLYGVGEMVVPAVAPAVANAIFDATGVRIRELPLTPERVLRALKESASAKARVVEK